MPSYRKKVLPKSVLLWLYTIPATLLLMLPGHYHLALYFPVYIFMILVMVFWQDYVTFGLLQSHLETKVSANIAAIMTAFLFLLGHMVFPIDHLADPQFAIIASAGFLFSFSRRYIGNIYIANVLHFCTYLI